MRGRIRPIIRKEVLHIRRDPRTLYLAIGMPIVLLILFGYAITMDIRHVAVGVIDLDRSSLSRDLIGRIRGSGYFDLRYLADDYGLAERSLDEGQVKVVLVIPDGLARETERNIVPPPLQLLVDGSNNNVALIALGYMSRLVQDYAVDIVTEKISRQAAARGVRVPSVEAETRIWFNPELRSTNYIVPGLIAVVMMVMTGLLTSLTIAREWENGTMEQLIAGPVRPAEIVIGKLVPYFGLGFAQVALVFTAGRFLFGVPFTGSGLCLIVTSAVFLFNGLCFGLLLSIVARSQQLAFMLAVILTLLPSIILSGFIFPISSMPKPLQVVTYIVPARYFLYALRGMFLKGYGFGFLWPEIISLALLGVLVFLACLRTLKMRLD
jgi:ABC-2 type transport system permease protein